VPPGVDDGCGGRGPNPFRRFLQVQRKLDAPLPVGAPGIERSQGCACGLFWLQNSTGGARSRCFIRSEPQARPRIRLGLAIQPRARVVKGRRKPVPWWKHRGPGARLPVIPCLSAKRGVSQARLSGPAQAEAEEAALVDGRRLGSSETVAFDEAAAEIELGGVSRARREVGLGQMAATRDVRGYAASSVAVENAVIGRPSAEELRSKLHQACAGSLPGPASRLRPECLLGAVAAMPKLEHRRQATLHLRICVRSLTECRSAPREAARRRGRARESDSPEGARLVSRLQKLVRRIFPVDPARGATRGRPRLDSLRREAGL